MDDMNLFDRFHAAFDVAPPAGGFERLRRELSNHRPDRRGRPAFHMRWNKMGLRLAAVVTVAVIAIALAAAYLAGQHLLTGAVPAGSNGSVAAYQSLVRADGDAFMALPFYCGNIDNPGCPSDLAAHISVLQKWSADLKAFRTPQQFTVIDGQMQHHVGALIHKLTLASSAMSTSNSDLFSTATTTANDDRSWLGMVATAISQSHMASTSNYTSLIQAEGQLVRDCASCQDLAAPTGMSCTTLLDTLCPHDLSLAVATNAHVEADIIQTGAPTQLAGRDATLQLDAAVADDALIQMETALVDGDASALKKGQLAYQDAMVAISTDLQS